MRKRLFSNGFTLIEIIVVVAVIMIVTGFGIANYLRFNAKQQVENSVLEAKTFIRTAQRKAQARETPAVCANSVDNNPLDSYRVFVQNNTLLMGANCGVRIEGAVGEDLVPTIINGETYELSLAQGATVNPRFDVRFLTLQGGIEVLNDNEFTVGKGEYQYSFFVQGSGEITEGNWAEDATAEEEI